MDRMIIKNFGEHVLTENEFTESEPAGRLSQFISVLGQPLRRVSLYLPMLAGPVAMCVAMVYCRNAGTGPGGEQALNDWASTCELYAPLILTVALAIYWGKAIFTRNLTYVVLGVLVGVLLLRELHWKPETEDAISIKDAVFPLLGICFAWMLIWLWWGIIDKPADNWLHTIFFYGAIVTYAFGQFVEKRLFKFIPDEGTFHTQFEESIECAGHCLIFLAALLGSWKRRKIIIKGMDE